MGLASLPEEEKSHSWRQRLRAMATSQGKPGKHGRGMEDPPAGVRGGEGLPTMTSDYPIQLQEGVSVGLSCPVVGIFCYSNHRKRTHPPLKWSPWVHSLGLCCINEGNSFLIVFL